MSCCLVRQAGRQAGRGVYVVCCWWVEERAEQSRSEEGWLSGALLHDMTIHDNIQHAKKPKVPPVITHAKLGTLYEEPCIVYIKV